MSQSITAEPDPQSPTYGIQAAIEGLGEKGGIVRVPAGEWPLRASVVLSSRVALIGDGPATVLSIKTPTIRRLSRAARKGARSVRVRGMPPFRPGDAVAITDSQRQWWDGSHALVASVEPNTVRLTEPLTCGVRPDAKACIASMFPAITNQGRGGPGDRDPTLTVTIQDLMIRGAPTKSERVWDFTLSAIHLVKCYHAKIANIFVGSWPSDGIGVQGGSDVQVTDCQVSWCRGNGYHPGTGLRRSAWRGNIAIGNGWDGIYLCGHVVDSVFSGNVLTGNGKSGIGGVGHGEDRHNVINNNVCSENAQWGIDAFDGADHVISGNIIRANSQAQSGRYAAIRLHNVERFIVHGNRCGDDQAKPTQALGIVETGMSDFNLVADNICSGMQEPIRVIGTNSQCEANIG